MPSLSAATAKIASASGSVTDRRYEFAELARHEDVNFIVGDWMSEYNMTTRGGSKVRGNSQIAEYEDCFLESILPALEHLDRRGIKVAVNAGASDTEKLHDFLVQAIAERGLGLKVAWVEGDEVFEAMQKARATGIDFRNLTTGQALKTWDFEPIYAQCYLGSFGILAALQSGADIVVCGRVADASPTIACAAYFHGWGKDSLSELAHAFVAGHFLECSTYVTGGNFSGFKSLPGDISRIGFPIAEIATDGTFVVTKQADRGGMVTVETCKAQLLYEIQGPLYYNSDVVAELSNVEIRQVGDNRVRVSNVGYRKPPPTTKVGLTARGGYQAEVHYFMCGLDIAEKAAMAETQIRAILDTTKYHTLKFRTNGHCPAEPTNQDSATVDFRIFAQSHDETALQPQNFLRPVTDIIMQSYPGATFAVDTRQGVPKPYYEYFVTLIPQSEVKHIAVVPSKQLRIEIPPPTDTLDFVSEQSGYETENPIQLETMGPFVRAPLGHIIHARSGDKGSDANVGFFVRNADEWDWLRSVLSVKKIRELLADDDVGKPIYRFELPNIWAVHFLFKDHLDRGVASSSTYDVLGKNLAEYLRCKHVDIPTRFYERGRI